MSEAFYARLLDLVAAAEPAEVLREALDLAVEITGAERGFIELIDGSRRLSWSSGFDTEEVALLRAQVSTSVIRETLVQGQTLVLRHALSDPRFATQQSVQDNHITRVLCVPIGLGLGVVYLEGRAAGGRFTEADQGHVERMGRLLGLLFDRVVASRRAPPQEGWDPYEELDLEGLVGESAAMRRVIEAVDRVSGPVDSPVVLVGETGVGKTSIARIIAANSDRRGRDFVVFNCGELSESLVESELFGAVAGAHSTASRDRSGVLAEAHGGTLFLDEVHLLSRSAQGALLRFLEGGDYRPVGAARSRQADVRVLAATNLDPEEALASGVLREDFWWRLAVNIIEVPALSERQDDVLVLARRFCDAVCQRYRMEPRQLLPETVAALRARSWPGNVRELRNLVERAVLASRRPPVLALRPEHFEVDPAKRGTTLKAATDAFTATFIRDSLRSCGSVAEAIEVLGIGRSTFYDHTRRLGIDVAAELGRDQE